MLYLLMCAVALSTVLIVVFYSNSPTGVRTFIFPGRITKEIVLEINFTIVLYRELAHT